MTVEELLQAAAEACEVALAVSTEDPMECAAVAQAAANTAQAMILAQMTTTVTSFNDIARWLRVDTGN